MKLDERYDAAVQQYRYKIHYFAISHVNQLPGFGVEDLEQELHEVLFKVTRAYDPNRGAKFNTLFWQSARNRLSDLTQRAQTEKRKSEWFDFAETLDEDAVTLAYEIGDWQSTMAITPEDWYFLHEAIRERFKQGKKIA